MKTPKILSTLVVMYAVFLSSLLWGQSTGTLSGKVTSPNGSGVPSASVVVTDTSGTARNTISGQDGSFTVPNLPAGTYTVQVEVPGFKRLSQQNVQVIVGSPINLTLGVEQGSQAETVEVQGQAPLGNDRTAEVARSYAGQVITQLPIQDLNHQQLVELMPGVTPPLTSTNILADPQSNRIWNTNGQPSQANNSRLDGVENIELFRGPAVHVPTIEAIQQLNLSTSNYDAQQGRAAGSIIAPITKAGTNGIHGSLFEYHSNDWFRARSYFNPSPYTQPRYTSNQFGGTVGGAIVPDHTFLFLSYEGDYTRDQTPTFATVPTAAFAAGNFSGLPNVTIYNPATGFANGTGRTAFTNNVIASNLINPAARAFLAAFPAPNLSGFENNYFANVPMRNDGNRADMRLDHRFSSNTSMFARYGLSYYNTSQDSVLGPLSADGGNSRLRAHTAAIGASHAFGPTTITDLRLGYTRYSDPIYANPGMGSIAGFTNGLPSIQITGLPALGSNASYPQINKEDTFNIVNDWHARVFHQDLRFGVDLWQVRVDGFQNLLYGPQGGYSFSPGATSIPGATLGRFGSYANSLAAFLLGAPTQAGITSSSFLPSYYSRQYSGYIADRLNIRRLSIDLGLRYDFYRPIEPRASAANYSIYNPATNSLQTLGTDTVDRYGNVGSNTLNFSPRIGLALRFDDRTVLRAGYGMSYWNGLLQTQAATLTSAFTGAQTGVAGSYAVAGTFGAFPAVSASNTAGNIPYYFSPNQVRTPYVHFYNFGIQRDVTHGILFDISYVGNLGRELPYTQDINAAAPGMGTAGMPLAASGRTAPTLLRGTGMTSNYNSLQINATKRFSQGIAFTAAYTWSKSLDYGAGLTPFLNNLNPLANYGPSDFDRTQMFTLSHSWRLPFGTGTQHLSTGALGRILGPWELDGIFRWATGVPFTPTASAAACACPGNTATADLVPNGTVSGINYYPSYFGYYYYAVPYQFQSFAFAQPAAGSFGNIGRNSVRGPDFTNYDLALSRSFVFVERTRLDFRAEAYNIANSVNFAAPITNVNSSNFGLSTSTAPGLGARTFQFAVKLVF